MKPFKEFIYIQIRNLIERFPNPIKCGYWKKPKFTNKPTEKGKRILKNTGSSGIIQFSTYKKNTNLQKNKNDYK